MGHAEYGQLAAFLWKKQKERRIWLLSGMIVPKIFHEVVIYSKRLLVSKVMLLLAFFFFITLNITLKCI